MTDADLTSQEQVNKSIGMCRLHGLHNTEATLRALSAQLLDVSKREAAMIARYDAKLDAAEAARDRWRSMWEKGQTHNEELEAKLRKAVDVLSGEDDRGYCLSPDARAFLASLEGDKPDE